ncbi:MAG: HD domain-containing protein [Caldilineaceae bacterium]|nr:HD domain-containing protein [Caldilineaceae bacterium]
MNERLTQQLAFLNEIEQLKIIYRRNQTVDRERFENSAEHSWHVALMALVLAEHAATPNLDLFKVVKMLLIHDLVEVYAGDTWLYDVEAATTQAEREEASAAKLYALLPATQSNEFTALWQEFTERQTPEAQFAAAIDALQPVANYLLTGRPTDPGPRPRLADVLARKQHIGESSPLLWEIAQSMIEECAQRGLYAS